jgi:hypothetical protein
MTIAINIGIIGDFNEENPTHIATTNDIEHRAEVLGMFFEAVWLPTDEPQEFFLTGGS